jgi:hypothetical protein
MVEEKRWLSGIGIFETSEQFSALDNLGALLAQFQFKHKFLTSRGALISGPSRAFPNQPALGFSDERNASGVPRRFQNSRPVARNCNGLNQ